MELSVSFLDELEAACTSRELFEHRSDIGKVAPDSADPRIMCGTSRGIGSCMFLFVAPLVRGVADLGYDCHSTR